MDEKQTELAAINQRNELLITQMCEAHKTEVRCLKERISELERQLRQSERQTTVQMTAESAPEII